MRLLQIVADGTPGGGTTCVLQLTEDLVAAGHQVDFISQRGSYAIQSANACGARVHDAVDFFRSRMDRGAIRTLAQAVARIQPQLVHLHGGRAAFYFVSGKPQSISTKSVYTVHGYHFTCKKFWLRWLAKAAERKINRRVKMTVFVSEYDHRLASQLRLMSPEHAQRIVYNGVSADELPTLVQARNPKRVAAVGRLTFQKDPHRVLDIATKLRNAGFVFDMIGGGEMEDEIRQRVQREQLEHVTVHGAISRQQTLELLNQAGAFLLASRWEGLPIAPLEAMICGIPVVLSDVGGNPEVVEHGKSGWIVPQTDTEGFAICLRELVADPQRTQAMIENARQRVAQNFSRTAMRDNYVTVYQRLLS